MDDKYYKQFEPYWGQWYIKELLGEGSFGKCYSIEKQDMTGTYQAALKVISVPQSADHVRSVRATGMSDADVSAYFKAIARDISGEFVLMEKLRGDPHIVICDDHAIRDHEDGIGCDIFIRMELLTPADRYFEAVPPTESELIRLGIDISKALETCAARNVIHRDVKPANIFRAPNASYKLGDFGVARTVEVSCGEFSKKGTYDYMAPEVYCNAKYDTRADIFSLGIVLYKLMNDGRIPFLPPAPDPIAYGDKDAALSRRLDGDTPPAPANASAAFSSIILKACESNVERRYQSAAALRRDLEKLRDGTYVIPAPTDAASDDHTDRQRASGQTSRNTAELPPKPADDRPPRPVKKTAKPADRTDKTLRRLIPILIGVIAATAAAFVVVLLSPPKRNTVIVDPLPELPETAETEPAETEPAETEPAETEPAETEPAEVETVKGETTEGGTEMEPKDPQKEDWRRGESATETYEELYIDGKPTGQKRNVKKKPPKTTETKEDKIEWKPVETETETYEEKYVNGVATGEKRNVKKKTVEEPTPEEAMVEWRIIEKTIDENHSETFEAEYINGVATGNTRDKHTVEWKYYEDDNESYEEKYVDGRKTGEKRKEKKYTWKAGESETETFEEQYYNGQKTGKKRNVKPKEAPVTSDNPPTLFDDTVVANSGRIETNSLGEYRINYYNAAGELVYYEKRTIKYDTFDYVLTKYDRFGNVISTVNLGIVPADVLKKIKSYR